jgi:hypothetical protein
VSCSSIGFRRSVVRSCAARIIKLPLGDRPARPSDAQTAPPLTGGKMLKMLNMLKVLMRSNLNTLVSTFVAGESPHPLP